MVGGEVGEAVVVSFRRGVLCLFIMAAYGQDFCFGDGVGLPTKINTEVRS